MSLLTHVLNVSQEAEPDLISAIFARDWAAVGGWSLFVMLGLFLIFSVVSERLVPGRAHRRQIEANEKLSEAVDALTTQNGQLITSNEITKHFFQETVPKRGEAREWDTSPVERKSLGQTPTL